ncbi:hypothetical protein C8R44DRAFT_333510 [Mycena epipterygia]|nr:hypothetical protein C8R44DRAFT_333510 [Mycena epipterygia]
MRFCISSPFSHLPWILVPFTLHFRVWRSHSSLSHRCCSNSVQSHQLPLILLIVTSVFGWDILLPVVPFFALSLATNVLVTTLTAARIWWICRQARAYLRTDLQKRCVSSISIIVESGVIYSASVLAYLIFGAIPSASIVQEPIMQMLAQVVGIVPTLIIVRVGLGVSIQSTEATVKAAEEMSGDTLQSQCPLGVIRMERGLPYDLEKDMPSIPYDDHSERDSSLSRSP